MVMQINLTKGSSQDYVFIKNCLKGSFKSHSDLSSNKKNPLPLGGSVQLILTTDKKKEYGKLWGSSNYILLWPY